MYSKYSNNLWALLEKVKEISPKVTSFEDSWLFIMEGNNSLLPYSNIIFWLFDNVEYMKDEYKEFLFK